MIICHSMRLAKKLFDFFSSRFSFGYANKSTWWYKGYSTVRLFICKAKKIRKLPLGTGHWTLVPFIASRNNSIYDKRHLYIIFETLHLCKRFWSSRLHIYYNMTQSKTALDCNSGQIQNQTNRSFILSLALEHTVFIQCGLWTFYDGNDTNVDA